MTVRITLLSGPLAVGKSAVADALAHHHGHRKISSSGYLRSVAKNRQLPATRHILQDIGDVLDLETEFAWLVESVAQPQIASEPQQMDWFIDAVRKPEQVQHFRNRYPSVLHVHFRASEDVLRKRFSTRARVGDKIGIEGAYEQAVAHANEQAARSLGAVADLILDLGEVESREAADLIVTHWRNPRCIG